jgi:hypothetical protein
MRQARRLCTVLFGASMVLGAGEGLEAAAPPGGASPGAAPATCDPDGQLRYVCGPVNAEDILQLGDTRWLVASGLDGPLNGGAPARGHLYLIDSQAKTAVDWFPGTAPVFNHDRSMFPDCPGPLDVTSFSAHGLALRSLRPEPNDRIYVTGHGAREAIEVFEVATGEVVVRGSRSPGFVPPPPAIRWVGCVVLPEKVSANSVATLPDGGFITTQFMDRSLPVNEAMGQVRSGVVNGALWEWHPHGKVERIAGTEMSGANGIVVSPDGRTIFVSAYGTHELVRFERTDGGVRRQVAKLPITPDNLHWKDGGKLIIAGPNYPAAGPGDASWSVLEVDPQTLAAKKLAGGPRPTGMLGVTAAIQVGDTVWLGTFSGNRVGYLPVQ